MPRWHKDSAGDHSSNPGCAPDRMFTSLFQSSEESGAEPPDQAASGLALIATPTPTKTPVSTPAPTDAPVSSPMLISRPTLTPASTAVNTPTTKPTPTSALAPAYPINMGLDADSLWREAFDSFDLSSKRASAVALCMKEEPPDGFEMLYATGMLKSRSAHNG